MDGRYRTAGLSRGIMVATDVVALVLVLWIVLFLLKANPANDLVHWVHTAADWLSPWAHDLFTPSQAWLRTLLNYGIPAVVYLLLGHVLASRVRPA